MTGAAFKTYPGRARIAVALPFLCTVRTIVLNRQRGLLTTSWQHAAQQVHRISKHTGCSWDLQTALPLPAMLHVPSRTE